MDSWESFEVEPFSKEEEYEDFPEEQSNDREEKTRRKNGPPSMSKGDQDLSSGSDEQPEPADDDHYIKPSTERSGGGFKQISWGQRSDHPRGKNPTAPPFHQAMLPFPAPPQPPRGDQQRESPAQPPGQNMAMFTKPFLPFMGQSQQPKSPGDMGGAGQGQQPYNPFQIQNNPFMQQIQQIAQMGMPQSMMGGIRPPPPPATGNSFGSGSGSNSFSNGK